MVCAPKLPARGMRTKVDDVDSTINCKGREAESQELPYGSHVVNAE